MHNFYRFSFLLLAMIFIFTQSLKSDHRKYVWTYQYMTMDKGKAEFENYLTFSTTDAGNFENNTTLENQFELEVGMTENFDFSIYQVYKQKPGGSLNFDSYKLRARYKLVKKDDFLFDPMIYAEYKGSPDFLKHKFEFKLIMAKDLGHFNVSLNPIIEFEKSKNWQPFFSYSIGMSYEFFELLSLGLEFKGNENGHYFAPVISHGSANLWIAAAPTFMLGGIKSEYPEFLFRTIIGVGI